MNTNNIKHLYVFIFILLSLIILLKYLETKHIKENYDNNDNIDINTLIKYNDYGLVSHIDRYKKKDKKSDNYIGTGPGFVLKDKTNDKGEILTRNDKLIIDPLNLRFNNETDTIFNLNDVNNKTKDNYSVNVDFSKLQPYSNTVFKA